MPDNKDNNGYVAPPVQQREAKQKTMATKPITSLAQIDVRKKLTSEEIGLINRSRERDSSRQNNASDGIVQAKTDPPTGEHPAEERAAEANTAEVRTSGNVQTPQGRTQTPQIAEQNTPNNAEVRIPEENPAEVRTKGTIQNPQTPAQTPQGPVVIPPGEVPLTSETTVEKDKQATEAVKEVKEAAEKSDGSEAKPYEITSTVGKMDATEEEKANLGADVAFVQGHLLRLGILAQKDYDAEKVTVTEAIDKSAIPKTIEAIYDFQNNVLGYNSEYGYMEPEKGSIKELVSLSPEDVIAKRAAVTTKRKEEAKEAEREKRMLEEKELMMRVQEKMHLNMVVHAIREGTEGRGTDERKVISALKSLKNDDRLIKEAKKRYKDFYKDELIAVITSELSNVGRKNYLEKALGYLNIKGEEKKNGDKSGSEEGIESIMKKDRLTPEEIAKVRALIVSLDESERAKYYVKLQGKVNYENQRDSEAKSGGVRVEGEYGGICNLTSLSMVLQYLGISNPYPDMQYEDALEKVRQDNNYGSRTTSGGWSAVAKKLGAEFEFIMSDGIAKNKSWWNSKVKSKVEEGYGIMMSIQGHIVRLQGINENGLIIDDPYGKIDLQKRYDKGFKGGYVKTNDSEWNHKLGNKSNEGEDNVWEWKIVEKYPMRWIAAFKK